MRWQLPWHEGPCRRGPPHRLGLVACFRRLGVSRSARRRRGRCPAGAGAMMRTCPPRCPTATRPRPTAGSRRPRVRPWVGGRCRSTCMCRTARPAAATATSTPTPPRSSVRGCRARPGWIRPSRRSGSPAPCSVTSTSRWRRCSSAGARRPCSRPPTWCAPSTRSATASAWPRGPRSPRRRTPTAWMPPTWCSWPRAGSPASRTACSRPSRMCCAPSTGRTTPNGCRGWSPTPGRPGCRPAWT